MSASIAQKARQLATSASRASGPIIARTRTIHQPIAPVAYDCVKLIFIRDGSAILLSEFGERPVTVGDVVTLAANALCGSEPEVAITVTTLYLDRDYIIDQVFWQHSAFLTDRWDAQDFADELYSEPAQTLRLGEDRAWMLMPWLDELVSLSLDGPSPEHFYRMQALLFAVLDVITPYVKTTPVRRSPTQRKSVHTPPLRSTAGSHHTGATWMVDAGIPLHVLQGILGHQSIETTKGYLHSDHRHLAAAAKQANQFLSAPSPRREPTRRDGPHL